MTIKLSSLKADLAQDAAGEWIEFPDWPGVAFKVSSIQLPAYVAARSMMLQKQSRRGGVLLDEASPDFGKLYARHLLHDWRGLDEAYSPAKAEAVLTDPEYRAVTQAVAWCATQAAAVDAEVAEDMEKNSPPPSAGA